MDGPDWINAFIKLGEEGKSFFSFHFQFAFFYGLLRSCLEVVTSEVKRVEKFYNSTCYLIHFIIYSIMYNSCYHVVFGSPRL